jgi:hypothetical protein
MRREVHIKLAQTRIKMHKAKYEPLRDKAYEEIANDLKEKKHDIARVKVEKLLVNKSFQDATIHVEYLLDSLLNCLKVISQR